MGIATSAGVWLAAGCAVLLIAIACRDDLLLYRHTGILAHRQTFWWRLWCGAFVWLGLVSLGFLRGVPAALQQFRRQETIVAAPDGPDARALLETLTREQSALSQSSGIHNGPTDPAEMEKFLAPLFSRYRTALHVPGAVCMVVKDGQVFFTKGYGFADVEKQTPVLPDRTLFRVASVSKLFMATAVMQLKEAGRLDMNANVNRYLKEFQLPNTYSQPVTLSALLTHTAGFDEQIIGMAARTADKVPSLGTYIANRMPPRVMPPGYSISYSNHGSALAGYVVEAVSGEPFAEYVKRHILEPLEMRHSSFILPPELAPDMATGYTYDYLSHTLQIVPFDYMRIGPAGALNATAGDMAHFMIAHLQEGRYGNGRILSAKAAREMHSQHFSQHPRLPGFAYGFYERYQNGRRAIEHGGLWNGFATSLFLLPSDNVGLFVSCNATEPRFGELIVQEFLQHYYPLPPDRSTTWQKPAQKPCTGVSAGPSAAGSPIPAPSNGNLTDEPPISRSRSELARFTGLYRYNRYDRHSFLRLFVLGSDLKISAEDNRFLILHIPEVGETRWEQVDPLLFRLSGTDHYLAFHQDREGHVMLMCLGIADFERVPWYDTVPFQLSVLLLTMILFGGSLLLSLLGRLLPENCRLASTQMPLPLARLSAATCRANLMFLVFFPVALVNSDFSIVYGVPTELALLLVVPIFTIFAAIVLAASAFVSMRHDDWQVPARFHFAILFSGIVFYLLWLNHWNLIGIRI